MARSLESDRAAGIVEKEGILYADIDPEEIVKGRYELDVAGHYYRPDIFSFRINLPGKNQ